VAPYWDLQDFKVCVGWIDVAFCECG